MDVGITVTADESWTRLCEALVRELTELPGDSFLLLRDPAHGGKVAQFWQSWDDLRAEVGGDDVNGGPPVLTEQDREALVAAGYSPPGDFNTDGGNWWRIIPVPVTADDYRSLAEAAITALRDVHRIPDPSALIYHAWGYATGHRLLDLPGVSPDPAKY